jgi:glycosidase
MPDEFWREAIAETRRHNPDFLFVAEAYWGKEPFLQELGFDYTYNKTLYDRIAGRGWDALLDYLELTAPDFLARSLHFIENHDEDRAQTVFGHQLHRQAAVLVTTIPGAPMIHQGQMEGRREKLPVQLVRPRTNEQDDLVLQEFYRKLLGIAAEPVFRAGRFHPFDSGIRGLVTYLREYERQRVLVAVDFRPERDLHETGGTLSIPRHFFRDLPEGEYRLRDVWNGEFERPARLGPSRMAVDFDSCRDSHLPFCILEILV